MADALKPQDDKQTADAVQWALAEGKRLEIVGRGSKRALGRPSQSDITLDLSGLSGVTLYEPEELVLSAKAGTPIAEIEALIDAKGQQLAFEPMDCGPLLGSPANADAWAVSTALSLALKSFKGSAWSVVDSGLPPCGPEIFPSVSLSVFHVVPAVPMPSMAFPAANSTKD